MSERTLILGYYLGNRYTQLAVYDKKTLEPVLIGQTEDNPDGLMETAIAVNDLEMLRGFVSKIQKGETIEVDGRQSQPVNVLAHYFSKTLALTRQQYPGETIKKLVVTVTETTREFVEIIYEALEKIGIGRDRAVVIGNKQSFLYYVLYQRKEIWVNDVGLFDYSEGVLRYYQMQVERGKRPILVGVHEKDYSDVFSFSNTGIDQIQRPAAFENVVYGAIHKQLLSALYMTGEGFLDGWADEVFQKLCIGRRLFKGQNLYVSGACYGAREMAESPRLADYLLLDQDMITSHISIQGYRDADVQKIVLARAGTPWYQVDEEIDIIPNGDNEVTLTAENIFDHSEKQFIMDFEPVLTKVDRQCRIGIRVRFAEPHKCIVTLKDKGFGDLFPSSYRVWEKVLELR